MKNPFLSYLYETETDPAEELVAVKDPLTGQKVTTGVSEAQMLAAGRPKPTLMKQPSVKEFVSGKWPGAKSTFESSPLGMAAGQRRLREAEDKARIQRQSALRTGSTRVGV